MKAYAFTTEHRPQIVFETKDHFGTVDEATNHARTLANAQQCPVKIFTVEYIDRVKHNPAAGPPPTTTTVKPASLSDHRSMYEAMLDDWRPAAEKRFGPRPTMIQILARAIETTLEANPRTISIPRKKPPTHQPSED